jgi:hypothetical protein
VSPRTSTRKNTTAPVTRYIAHIHDLAASLPAKMPCSIDRVKVGIASMCSRRHHVMPIRRFVHEDVITTTIAYIAITPTAVATGRYSARSGTSRSGSPNGMKLSISSPPRWTPSSASPTVATN